MASSSFSYADDDDMLAPEPNVFKRGDRVGVRPGSIESDDALLAAPKMDSNEELKRTSSGDRKREHRRVPKRQDSQDEDDQLVSGWRSRLLQVASRAYFELLLIGLALLLLMLWGSIRRSKPAKGRQLLYATEQFATWLVIRALITALHFWLSRFVNSMRVKHLFEDLGFSITNAVWALLHMTIAPQVLEADSEFDTNALFKLYVCIVVIYALNVIKSVLVRLWLVRFHIQVFGTQITKLVAAERSVRVLLHTRPEDASANEGDDTVDNASTLLAHGDDLAATFHALMHSIEVQRGKEAAVAARHEQQQKPADLKAQQTAAAEAKADRILANVDRGAKGFISIEDIDALTSTDEASDAILRTFCSEPETEISRQQLVSTIIELAKQRDRLYAMIYNRGQLSLILHRASAVLFYIVAVVATLIFFNASFLNLMLPIATFVLSLSFVFADALKQSFASLLVLFVARPFAVGDRITLKDHPTLVIDRINLLTTEAHATDGRSFILPNSLLLSSTIIQYRRSGEYALSVEFQVAAQISPEKFDELEMRILAFLRTDRTVPWNHKDNYLTWVSRIERSNELTFNVWIGLRGVTWQEPVRYLSAQTVLILQVQRILTEMGITYELPPQPLQLHSSLQEVLSDADLATGLTEVQRRRLANLANKYAATEIL